MSTLRILRPGYQTWNNDFIQWLGEYSGSTVSLTGEPYINTDYFTGTIYITQTLEGFYSVYGELENTPGPIDTRTADDYLSLEVADLSSILPINSFAPNTVLVAILDSEQATRMATLYFSTTTSKLYVNNGFYIPANQYWYLNFTLYAQSVAESALLSTRVRKRIKKFNHIHQEV